MKKTIIIFLIAIVSVTLVGCGSDKKNSDENDKKEKNSVSDYIDNSKKSSFIDIAVTYVKAVRTKVNEGRHLQFFDTSILYMVPVGDDSSKACVNDIEFGAPIFGDKWNYGYVGVVYDGSGYNYYYIGEDNSIAGFPMLSEKELINNGKEYFYNEYSNELSDNKMTKEFAETLAKTYGTSVKVRNLTSDEKKAFSSAISDNNNPNKVTKILYVDNNCKYQAQ